MTRKNIRKTASIALTAALILSAASFAYADSTDTALTSLNTSTETAASEEQRGPRGMGGQGGQGGQFGGQGGQFGGMGGTTNGTTGNATSPSEIKTSDLTENSAEDLSADYANATTITMSSSNNSVKISSSGTYIITGTCTDGNIAVKKGTTGVVLILKDLDLTSTTGATVSLNKGTEVKVIIEGNVTLTDAEDIANEDSDDFDGAALKAKAGSSVVLTGTGTLTVNGSCKHGIKVSDLEEDDITAGYSEASFIIDGEKLTINVTAEEDGINSGTDLTIKSGTIKVSAGDDGIKADYILTIGEEGSTGPNITVAKSVEGLEGATINIYSGTMNVTASDDAINAANSDLTGYTYSLNIMGGTVNIYAGADGIDTNGNINITGGLTTVVKSASNGGEGGLDYEGSCYIADGCFVNPYGTTMDSGKGGMGGFGGMGGWGNQSEGSTDGTTPNMGGQFGGRGQMPGQSGEQGQMPQMDGNAPDFSGQQPPEMNGDMPQMDGNAPQFDGNAPQTDGSTAPSDNLGQLNDGSTLPDDLEIIDTTSSGNWFTDLINAIKNWFANNFGSAI